MRPARLDHAPLARSNLATHSQPGFVAYSGIILLTPTTACPPAGSEVLTVVDFGPDTDPHRAFSIQRQLNPPGQSPPFCSEFYISGSPSWGNSSNDGALQASTLREVLRYAGDTANVNLYMAHGGTSFGFWAGGWRAPWW